MNELVGQPGANGGLRELALFAGAGGGILGGHLLGWRTVCAVECDHYAASVLCARQNDGVLPPFPIWDDVRTFDGTRWRGRVDVVSGGFPCQDISAAGKGAGITGERSGLWSEMARIVGEVRPRFVFVENSPLLVRRGLAVVVSDLAQMGYNARWCVLGAGHLGAWHLRERIWLLAADSGQERISWHIPAPFFRERPVPWGEDGRSLEDVRGRPDIFGPAIRRNRNGVAGYVERISAIGNGQVPVVAETAWQILTGNVERIGGRDELGRC